MSSLSMSDAVAVTRASERRRLLWAGGSTFDVVLGPEHTGGHVALVDQSGARGDVTPMHVHLDEAEVFYVLDGSIRAFHGGTSLDLEAGSAIYLPPAQEHAFGVISERARILTLTTPGSFASFVTSAGVEIEGEAPTQWDFDLTRIMAAAAEHRIDITGPPPALD
jgi:quercetin dioxygenase-like cupin family protein